MIQVLRHRLGRSVLALGLALVAAACGTSDGDEAETASEPSVQEPAPATDDGATGDDDIEVLHPDVIGADAVLESDGTWTVSATLSSPYDTPARYADAWRVVGPDGSVFGVRELTHDHQAEQPFTRSQSGIEIPADVDVVTIEGRDQVSGWGGETFELELSR